jgi:hypothetical protein
MKKPNEILRTLISKIEPNNEESEVYYLYRNYEFTVQGFWNYSAPDKPRKIAYIVSVPSKKPFSNGSGFQSFDIEKILDFIEKYEEFYD